MRYFTDDLGRRWRIRFDDVRAVDRADQSGVDVRNLKTVDHWLNLEIKLAVQLLWMLIEPQAVRRGVSPEQFAESLRGSLENAFVAIVQAFADLDGLSKRRLRRLFWRRKKVEPK